MRGRECLLCGAVASQRGPVGVCCGPCWRRWRAQHPGLTTRGELIADLFEAHWIARGLHLGFCADCRRPLRSSPNLWRAGMHCLSCAHRDNAGRVLTTEQGRALQHGVKLVAAA